MNNFSFVWLRRFEEGYCRRAIISRYPSNEEKLFWFLQKKYFLDYLWSAEAGYVFSAIAECEAAFHFILEQDVSSVSLLFFLITFLTLQIISTLREGFKNFLKNYGKFHNRGGGGVSEGHFPYPIFFIFFAPNGLKIIFWHWSFFHV